MSDWVTLKNDLGLTLRPIGDAWPGKLRAAWQRKTGPYSAPLKDTLKVLKRELNALNAHNIVLQIAIREGDLRLDGLPKSQARAEHPGVILCFDVQKGSRRRAFDRFTHWQQNLRALSLNLEHLRLANLYGVEGDEQQYAGWQALPAPPSAESDSLKVAFDVFVSLLEPGYDRARLQEEAEFMLKYRTLLRKHHADYGGDPATFSRLQAAAAVIRKGFEKKS